MSARTLKPLPLTPERFAPFGDVIEAKSGSAAAMNEARFARFNDLAKVDADIRGEGHVAISIVRCRAPTALPYRIDMVERHPLGSQAFIPRGNFRFVVAVAPPAEAFDHTALAAFVTDGTQGINYHRGTWHMPLIAFAVGQEFLIVDRGGTEANCDEQTLDEPVILVSE